MPDDVLVRAGSTGDAVRDVQRRLTALGHPTGDDEPGSFGAGTERAVRDFQQRRGLRVDGICGRQTWGSLVEAGYRLGDRMLYLRSPMLRGDDVVELQRSLGALGFDAGRVDGILGAQTIHALVQLQRNAGLTTDGICGPDTIAALRRFLGRVRDDRTVATVRETAELRTSRGLRGRRVAVGEAGGLGALADALSKALVEHGAEVAVLHHHDGSEQASEANTFSADVFVGLVLRDEACASTSFFAIEGFESVGGRRLAEVALEALRGTDLEHVATGPLGMRLPILRETRMPAVLCEVGPPSGVVAATTQLAGALGAAVERWASEPIPD